jgi:hypothetical protein
MVRRLRLILTAGAFVVCVVITLATAVAVFRHGVIATLPPEEALAPPSKIAISLQPAPPAPNPELRRMLISQDLTKEPRDKRLAVALQIEQLARTVPDWRGMDQDLTPEERRRAEENLTELLRVWFLAKADDYAALERAKRTVFVDGLIDSLPAMVPSAFSQAKLGGAPTALPKLDAKMKGSAGQAAFAHLLTKWQDRTTAEEWAKAITLMMALQERSQVRWPAKGTEKRFGKQPKASPAP